VFHLFSDCHKILVLNGLDVDTSQAVESAEIFPPYKTCPDLQPFPVAIRATFGALLPDINKPIVCGGYDVNTLSNACFLYGSTGWKATFSMKRPRWHFTGMAKSPYLNDSHKMFILGGGSPSSEVLTDAGWEITGPYLPSDFYLSCMISINRTSILVIGGQSDLDVLTNSTYIFNSVNNRWVVGPSLNSKRRYFGCGKIRQDEESDNKLFLVAGGSTEDPSAAYTVELLGDVTDSWYNGN